MRFDLEDGFPLVTTKRLSFKTILRELLWFIAGQTNIEWLKAHNVHIWNEWADDDGELGPIYGKQWRFWEDTQGNEIDQLQSVITAIREDPNSRRHFVSAWNVADLPEMNLAPLSHALPVLRCQRSAIVPLIPAKRGRFSRGAIQYC